MSYNSGAWIHDGNIKPLEPAQLQNILIHDVESHSPTTPNEAAEEFERDFISDDPEETLYDLLLFIRTSLLTMRQIRYMVWFPLRPRK
jgi:hypothetical protein